MVFVSELEIPIDVAAFRIDKLGFAVKMTFSSFLAVSRRSWSALLIGGVSATVPVESNLKTASLMVLQAGALELLYCDLQAH